MHTCIHINIHAHIHSRQLNGKSGRIERLAKRLARSASHKPALETKKQLPKQVRWLGETRAVRASTEDKPMGASVPIIMPSITREQLAQQTAILPVPARRGVPDTETDDVVKAPSRSLRPPPARTNAGRALGIVNESAHASEDCGPDVSTDLQRDHVDATGYASASAPGLKWFKPGHIGSASGATVCIFIYVCMCQRILRA
jgi:hypothetical protein